MNVFLESTVMIIPTHIFHDIDQKVIVREIDTGEIVPETRDKYHRRTVKIKRRGGQKSYQRLDKLFLRTFKPLQDKSLNDAWVSVKFLDNNPDNISENNTFWDFSQYIPKGIPGVTHPLGTWFDVHGYDDVEITFDPDVKIKKKNSSTIYAFNRNTSGYPCVKIPGYSSTTVHRIVALAFLEHPIDWRDLTVNHKDSDITNFSLNNLEWITQQQNLIHSVIEGFTGDKIRKVQALCLETGIVYNFPSINSCAKYFNVSQISLDGILKFKKNRGKPWRGFLFRFVDEKLRWEEIKEMVFPIDRNVRIAVKYIDSGKIIIYKSFKELERVEKLNAQQLYRLVRRDYLIPRNNRLFQFYTGLDLTWPDYPPEIVEVLNRVTTKSIPYKVTGPDGSVEYVSSLREWSSNDSSRANSSQIASVLAKYGDYQGHVFVPIDLSDYATSCSEENI